MAKGWKTNINLKARDILSGATTRGLTLGAEHLLGESNKRVPLEEATLERSGTVSVDPAKLQAVVSYNTPHAVRQHEEMKYQHDAGREAKYLENAMNANVGPIRQIIAGELRKEL